MNTQTPRMAKCRDIMLGSAKVVAHHNGGWALPGGAITFCEDHASEVAARMHRMIGSKAPVAALESTIRLCLMGGYKKRRKTQPRAAQTPS